MCHDRNVQAELDSQDQLRYEVQFNFWNSYTPDIEFMYTVPLGRAYQSLRKESGHVRKDFRQPFPSSHSFRIPMVHHPVSAKSPHTPKALSPQPVPKPQAPQPLGGVFRGNSQAALCALVSLSPTAAEAGVCAGGPSGNGGALQKPALCLFSGLPWKAQLSTLCQTCDVLSLDLPRDRSKFLPAYIFLA